MRDFIDSLFSDILHTLGLLRHAYKEMKKLYGFRLIDSKVNGATDQHWKTMKQGERRTFLYLLQSRDHHFVP